MDVRNTPMRSLWTGHSGGIASNVAAVGAVCILSALSRHIILSWIEVLCQHLYTAITVVSPAETVCAAAGAGSLYILSRTRLAASINFYLPAPSGGSLWICDATRLVKVALQVLPQGAMLGKTGKINGESSGSSKASHLQATGSSLSSVAARMALARRQARGRPSDATSGTAHVESANRASIDSCPVTPRNMVQARWQARRLLGSLFLVRPHQALHEQQQQLRGCSDARSSSAAGLNSQPGIFRASSVDHLRGRLPGPALLGSHMARAASAPLSAPATPSRGYADAASLERSGAMDSISRRSLSPLSRPARQPMLRLHQEVSRLLQGSAGQASGGSSSTAGAEARLGLEEVPAGAATVERASSMFSCESFAIATADLSSPSMSRSPSWLLDTSDSAVSEAACGGGGEGTCSGRLSEVSAVDSLGRDGRCGEFVRRAVPEAFLLQFGAAIGEQESLKELSDRGIAPPWGHGQASIFGSPDTLNCGDFTLGPASAGDSSLGGWELIVEETQDPGLSYWAWRRPLRAGFYMYRSRTVLERVTPADVRDFNLDDKARFIWDDSMQQCERLPLEGHHSRESCVHRYRSKLPRPMASREYVYARRVWDRPSDGGAYVVNVACPHPAWRPAVDRTVPVTDYASCQLIRAARSLRGHPQEATELLTIYFEDSRLRAGIANIAVRNGLLNFVQKHEAGLRIFLEARERERAAAAQHGHHRRRRPHGSRQNLAQEEAAAAVPRRRSLSGHAILTRESLEPRPPASAAEYTSSESCSSEYESDLPAGGAAAARRGLPRSLSYQGMHDSMLRARRERRARPWRRLGLLLVTPAALGVRVVHGLLSGRHV